MTDTSTEPYAVTLDPDGRTWRRVCRLCPSGAAGTDEALILLSAADHQDRAHPGRIRAAAEGPADGEAQA